MSQKLYFRNYKMMLVTLAVFFIFLSITVHFFHNFFMFRLLRGIICFVALFYLLTVHGKNIQKWIFGFLLFYGSSSIATVWFENRIMASISMILNFIAFLMLLLNVLPKFASKNLTKTFTLLFVCMVLVNGYLFLQFVELMKEMTLSQVQYIFMILCAFCGILLGFLALFWNHFQNTPQSMAFTLLVFLIIFAEIFRAIGYYNLAYSTSFVYLGRIFLVLSLCALVHLSFMDLKNIKKTTKSLSQRALLK